MARRGRKPKHTLKISSDSTKSLFALVLLALAGLLLVSFFARGYTINDKLQQVVRGLFGYASIIIPFIIALRGLLYVRTLKLPFIEIRVLYGLIILLFSSAPFIHLFYGDDTALLAARAGDGGGLFGYYVGSGLAGLVSVYGAAIIFLIGIIFGFILIVDISLDEVFSYVMAFIQIGGEMRKKKLGDGSKDQEIDNDIKINAGGKAVDDEDKNVSEENLPEPSFEVVPSMAEPQSSKTTNAIDTSQASGLAPSGLPYADKVWEYPPRDLLIEPSDTPVDRGNVNARAKIIEDTLNSFGISAKVVEVNFGPSVTQYALETATGTKIAKVSSLQYDLALSLASPTGSVRIEAPIPGKSLIGIEVPNNTRVTVNFKELLESDAMANAKDTLPIVLGKDVGGASRIYNISKMPHLLVAGATGSGKSIFLHSLIFSLLFTKSPQEVKFIFLDPKRVELVNYNDIPHLFAPVITDVEKAAGVFKWATVEMKRRYKLFETAKVRNIDAYNEKSGFQALPNIVIVVDELAEIMITDPASVEKSIISLAQLARATGIHLILTVQRPSTNIITGLIKANIPCRVAFNVTSQVDSRVIIDQPGAEKLLGKGDMLFVPPDASKPIRIQGTFVADQEINALVSFLKSTGGNPDYNDEIFAAAQAEENQSKSISSGGDAKDDLYDEAVEIVVEARKASASLLQRRLSVGYARAARILDELEATGVVGPAKGSKPRDVLVNSVDSLNSVVDNGMAESEDFAPTADEQSQPF